MSGSLYQSPYSCFRGPCRLRNPVPKTRIDIGLQFEGCLRYSTLWQLIMEKKRNFPALVLPSIAEPNSEEGGEEVEQPAQQEEEFREISVSEVSNYLLLREPHTSAAIQGRMEQVRHLLSGNIPALEKVAYQISQDNSDAGVRYFEVHLDPELFATEDANMEAVVQAVLRGLKEGESSTSTQAGLILQFSQSHLGQARSKLQLCEKLRESGVVGIEMICSHPPSSEEGDEQTLDYFSPEQIKIFQDAKKSKVHRSVSFSSANSEQIFQAIEKLNAERVCEGYRVLQDSQLYQECIMNRIHFSTCPTLSLLSGAVSLGEFYHPVVKFAEDGLNLSVSSGMPSITGGWIPQDLDLCVSWGLSESYMANLAFNAAKSSFLDDQAKKELLKDMRKLFGMEDKVELEIFINHKCGLPDNPKQRLKVTF